jgi:hypothetical protein
MARPARICREIFSFHLEAQRHNCIVFNFLLVTPGSGINHCLHFGSGIKAALPTLRLRAVQRPQIAAGARFQAPNNLSFANNRILFLHFQPILSYQEGHRTKGGSWRENDEQ